jgi:predicted outer membrane repeat protein
LGQSYGTLQEAVAAASPEDTLKVNGTCYGTTTIAKNLTLVGQRNPGFGPARLDGQKSGSVVTVEEGVSAAIAGLTITGGSGSPEPINIFIAGGGIANYGSLTLTDSTVSGNTASDFGGGIFNDGEIGNGGALTINDSAISCNEAAFGGGIRNSEGSVTLNDSNVSRNTAEFEGGGIETVQASLTLANSTVEHNRAAARTSYGGGIALDEGLLTLTKSSVSGNTAVTGGGGIDGGVNAISSTGRNSITLNNSTVTGNTATGGPPVQGFEDPGDGGGIEDYAGTVTFNGSSSVSRNEAAGDGGGIYSGQAVEGRADSVILTDASSVTRNTASGEGGGIYSKKSEGATLTFGMGWTGTVSRNEPDDIFLD